MKLFAGAVLAVVLGCNAEHASFGVFELDAGHEDAGVIQPQDSGAPVTSAPPPATPPPPEFMICGPHASCSAGRYCDYPVSAHCGAGNANGLCLEPAQPCDMTPALVCGCDGVTYLNRCLASAASVSLRSAASCDAIDDAGAR